MIIIDYSFQSIVKQFRTEADSITIGRPSDEGAVNLNLMPDTTVSRRQARLSCEAGEYWLEDLGSRSGTWVNGKKITKKIRLAPNDEIKMGQTILIVHMDALERTKLKNPMVTQPMMQMEEADKTFTEGIFKNTIRATDSPSQLLLTEKSDQDRRRLEAFYDLGAALSTVREVKPLLRTVVEHLRQAVNGAQRGALLLLKGRQLSLKAYLPEKLKPSVSLHLAQRAIEKQESFIWQHGGEEDESKLTDSIIWHGTQCAIYAPLIWQEEVLGVVYVDNFVSKDAFTEDDLNLLTAMANQAAMFVKNHALQQDLRHEHVVRSNLMRQFSPQVAEHLQGLLTERGQLALGGERVEPVTILNSDVRGFTALSAQMDPKDVMKMLNQLFGACIPIIFKYNGTVDKYVGDAILSVFGSPEPDKYQWKNAVMAALEMQEAVKNLGAIWQQANLPVYEIGIGIHTGAVLQGFIGSDERMEYTVIGNTVNRASRYCNGAERGEVVISPAVYEYVADLVSVVPKIIRTKHPETEGDLEAYLIQSLMT